MSSRSGATTQFVASADGTRIAYQVDGTGPPLVLVDGRAEPSPARDRLQLASTSSRTASPFTPTTAAAAARAARAARPYDVQREVEDLAAVITVAGILRSTSFAHSAGAALALEAARQGVPIERMVCYEAPFILDDGHPV